MRPYEGFRLKCAYRWTLRQLKATELWLPRKSAELLRIEQRKQPLRLRLIQSSYLSPEARAHFAIEKQLHLKLALIEEQIEVLAYYRESPIYFQALRVLDSNAESMQILTCSGIAMIA